MIRSNIPYPMRGVREQTSCSRCRHFTAGNEGCGKHKGWVEEFIPDFSTMEIDVLNEMATLTSKSVTCEDWAMGFDVPLNTNQKKLEG